jgi:esterase/lipase superfamily enzyme
LNGDRLPAIRILMLALACAGRPLQGVLVPPLKPQRARRVILIATTCQRASDEAAEMFNKERAEAMSYAPIAVPQRVGSRPGEMLRAGKTDQ